MTPNSPKARLMVLETEKSMVSAPLPAGASPIFELLYGVGSSDFSRESENDTSMT